MPIINITSKLKLQSYDGEKLSIAIKQGNYNAIVEEEELTIVRNKEEFDHDTAEWSCIGGDYASIGSDLRFIAIFDEKGNDPILDLEWLDDNVDNFYHFENSFVFEIPCGTGGALSVYTAKNDNGDIVAVKFNGVHPEDM